MNFASGLASMRRRAACLDRVVVIVLLQLGLVPPCRTWAAPIFTKVTAAAGITHVQAQAAGAQAMTGLCKR